MGEDDVMTSSTRVIRWADKDVGADKDEIGCQVQVNVNATTKRAGDMVIKKEGPYV